MLVRRKVGGLAYFPSHRFPPGFVSCVPVSLGRWPSQCTTGWGGYFGYAGSVLDNWHSRKHDPLGVMISRIEAQVSQRLRTTKPPLVATPVPWRPGVTEDVVRRGEAAFRLTANTTARTRLDGSSRGFCRIFG